LEDLWITIAVKGFYNRLDTELPVQGIGKAKRNDRERVVNRTYYCCPLLKTQQLLKLNTASNWTVFPFSSNSLQPTSYLTKVGLFSKYYPGRNF
jgi:hypothetical protein